MAFSTVGGILSSMGLEGAGETFTKIGNTLMVIGAAASTLGPIISTVGTKF
jgi:hypothetical protein